MALYPRATVVIHYFLLVPRFCEAGGAAHSVCCQASNSPTLQRQWRMAEDQVVHRDGGTAIDAELRVMHFG